MIAAGFANYDLAYSLVWGADLAHGRVPDYEVSLAPTPHPLSTLEGLLLAPLGGASAEDVAIVIAFLSLGALGAVTYALAATWFGRVAGLIAAAIVLTRQPVLSFGVRGYADIPYLVLVLSALLVEARRPRAGTPVLVLLGFAGLLRPEAWLFSAAYVAWLARGDVAQWVRLGAIAARRPADLGDQRPARHRRPAALADRHARHRRGAATQDRPRRRAADRSAPARRDPARAGAARRRTRRPAVAGAAAQAGRAARRRPASSRWSRSASSPPPGCRSSAATCCSPPSSWRSSAPPR